MNWKCCNALMVSRVGIARIKLFTFCCRCSCCWQTENKMRFNDKTAYINKYVYCLLEAARLSSLARNTNSNVCARPFSLTFSIKKNQWQWRFAELTCNFNGGCLALGFATRRPRMAFALERRFTEILVDQILRNGRRHFLQLDAGVRIDMWIQCRWRRLTASATFERQLKRRRKNMEKIRNNNNRFTFEWNYWFCCQLQSSSFRWKAINDDCVLRKCTQEKNAFSFFRFFFLFEFFENGKMKLMCRKCSSMHWHGHRFHRSVCCVHVSARKFISPSCEVSGVAMAFQKLLVIW